MGYLCVSACDYMYLYIYLYATLIGQHMNHVSTLSAHVLADDIAQFDLFYLRVLILQWLRRVPTWHQKFFFKTCTPELLCLC